MTKSQPAVVAICQENADLRKLNKPDTLSAQMTPLSEIESREAWLVNELYRIGPITSETKRKSVRKRRKFEAELADLRTQKAAFLKANPDILRKTTNEPKELPAGDVLAESAELPESLKPAAGVTFQAAPDPEAAAANLEVAIRRLWNLPQTDAIVDARMKAESTLARLRAALASRKASPPSGVPKMTKSTTAPPARLFDGTPMAAEWRSRTAEEQRIAVARGLVKSHPASFGSARDSVTTVAQGKVVDEPAWTAFRRSRLQQTTHPALRRA